MSNGRFKGGAAVAQRVAGVQSEPSQLTELRGLVAAVNKTQATIEFTLDGTIVTANNNFLAAVGYSLDEIQGRHHSMFVDPVYGASAEYRQFWADLSAGRAQSGEFKRLGKGGKEIWILAAYNPILDDNGKPYKVVKFASDITASKVQNADYQGQLKAISTSQAVIEFTMDGTILTANNNFLAAVGYTLDEVKGKHHSIFVDARYRESAEYREFWAKLGRGEYQASEYQRFGKGGHAIWIQASYNPIADQNGKPFKVVKYATDITAQKVSAINGIKQLEEIVSDVLGEDPEIEIVGAAANGRIALQKLTQVQPDLVTLDVEMPEMNGLEALAAIRKTHPKLPIIMFSTLTARGASATIEALTLGASDYVTKPANVGSVGAAQQRVREDLIPKIKALCGGSTSLIVAKPAGAAKPTLVVPATRTTTTPPTTPRPLSETPRPDILAIGVSTGGPNALAEVIPNLPADFPVPVVITQHMPPLFTKFLADRLKQQSKLDVREAAVGDEVKAGTVLIAPGDYHIVLRRNGAKVVVALSQDPPENSCRPAVDVMFRSVDALYGRHTLALILTGMGQDGLIGCEYVKRSGGSVVVQDETTSIVWGMPGFVAKAGLADRVLPLNQIARELVNRTSLSSSRLAPTGTGL